MPEVVVVLRRQPTLLGLEQGFGVTPGLEREPRRGLGPSREWTDGWMRGVGLVGGRAYSEVGIVRVFDGKRVVGLGKVMLRV